MKPSRTALYYQKIAQQLQENDPNLSDDQKWQLAGHQNKTLGIDLINKTIQFENRSGEIPYLDRIDLLEWIYCHKQTGFRWNGDTLLKEVGHFNYQFVILGKTGFRQEDLAFFKKNDFIALTSGSQEEYQYYALTEKGFHFLEKTYFYPAIKGKSKNVPAKVKSLLGESEKEVFIIFEHLKHFENLEIKLALQGLGCKYYPLKNRWSFASNSISAKYQIFAIKSLFNKGYRPRKFSIMLPEEINLLGEANVTNEHSKFSLEKIESILSPKTFELVPFENYFPDTDYIPSMADEPNYDVFDEIEHHNIENALKK